MLVAVLEQDDDRRDGAEQDARCGERIRRHAGAGEAPHRPRGERARALRVAVLDRGRPVHRRDRTTAANPGTTAGWVDAARVSGPCALGLGEPGAADRAGAKRVALVDDRHRDQRDDGAGQAVEPEVVAARHHGEPDPRRPDDPERLRPPVPREAGEHDADDQRVARVQARHRRVGVGGELDEAVAVVVDESEPEQARRRHRHRDVAEEADHVREQDRVAEAGERVVVPK